MIKDDPTISEIRETRHKISEENDHDTKKVVDYYIELQKKYKERLLKTSEEEIEREPSVKA
jgi:hypothetical protein